MKTNNSKRLIAAVAILMMVACCFVVAMPSSEAVDPTVAGEEYDGKAITVTDDEVQNIYVPATTSETKIEITGTGTVNLYIAENANVTTTITGPTVNVNRATAFSDDGKISYVDDFTISGGTIVDVANALKAKGAKHIYCGLSHMILKDSGKKKIDESPIELLITTDTVNSPYVGKWQKLRVISAAPMFAECVRRIHDKEGIGTMIANLPEDIIKQSIVEQLSF